MKKEDFILWFSQVSIQDINLVGGKNASLGEMYTNLRRERVKFIKNAVSLRA